MLDAAVRRRVLERYPVLAGVSARPNSTGLFAPAIFMRAPVWRDDVRRGRGRAAGLRSCCRAWRACSRRRRAAGSCTSTTSARATRAFSPAAACLAKANYRARGLARTELELVMLPPDAFHRLFSGRRGLSRSCLQPVLGADVRAPRTCLRRRVSEARPAAGRSAGREEEPDPDDPSGPRRRARQPAGDHQPAAQELRRAGLGQARPRADRSLRTCPRCADLVSGAS